MSFSDGIRLRVSLFAGVGYVAECFAALVGNILPILCGYAVFGEKLGAHSHAEASGLDPAFDVFACGFYAAGYHDLGPGHGCHESLDEFRAEDVAGEAFAEVASGLLGCADFADGAASGCVGDEATVADA